jgi:hypothetical protein
MAKRKIPFKFTPAAWGLKGKSYQRAEAEYYYAGEELERALAKIDHDEEKDQKRALLEIDKKYGHKTKNEYEKEIAQLDGEPWVGVIKSEFHPENEVNGLNFELDWNDEFVEMLRQNGYEGVNEDRMVESWFNDLCTAVAMEQGVFEDLTGGAEEVQTTGTTRKFVDDTGKASYS